MAGLFDKLEREAFRGGIQARTKESMRWFRTRVSQMKSVNRTSLMKDARNRKRFIYGDMYMYMYDPKHKQTLPYYDRFPLTIPIEPAKGGFLGLNLHYLPHTLRAQFLDQLYDRTNNTKYDESTRFNVSSDSKSVDKAFNNMLPFIQFMAARSLALPVVAGKVAGTV